MQRSIRRRCSLIPLYERVRPTSWDGVCGQDKAVSQLRRIESAGGFAGQAFYLSGISGSGKTTIARIIAGTIADPLFVREYSSADELTTGELDECERLSHLSAWGKGGRAFIVNEAHGLKQSTLRRLLGILEPVAPRSVWIFTTTNDGDDYLMDGIDGAPLLSRCIPIKLSSQGLAQVFAERVRTIAQAEGLDGRPIAEYVKLAQKRRNNMRAMLQDISAGAMIG